MPVNDTCPACGGSGKIIDRVELRARRIKNGMAQNDCAKAMGISACYLADLEFGRRAWDADKLARFNKALK